MNTKQNDNETLKKFFSAYFHQDWEYEADTPSEVVLDFLHDATAASVVRLRNAILSYVEDNEIIEEEALDTEFGCEYLPSSEGLTPKEWLLSIAELLKTKVDSD
jgi:hypothetical protein